MCTVVKGGGGGSFTLSTSNTHQVKYFWNLPNLSLSILGRDASRSFVTGDLSDKGLRDDVLDLKSMEMLELEKWKNIYEKEYTQVGEITKYVNLSYFFDG